MTAAASPWDALLRAPAAPPPRPVEPGQIKPGTKLATIMEALRRVDDITTHNLCLETDLTVAQVWGLLKNPRAHGEVSFARGRWALVRDFPGRDVTQAAKLLQRRGMSILAWQAVDPKSMPDADTTVLVWMKYADGSEDWASGWWDGQHWMDAATGDRIAACVTHWAEPNPPPDLAQSRHANIAEQTESATTASGAPHRDRCLQNLRSSSVGRAGGP